MVFNNFSVNSNELLRNIPPEISHKIENIIFISKIAIFIFIGYIIFLILKGFFNWRRNIRIDKMYHKVNEIDEKLNLLLKKEHLEKKSNKKKSFLKKLFKKNKKEKKK